MWKMKYIHYSNGSKMLSTWNNANRSPSMPLTKDKLLVRQRCRSADNKKIHSQSEDWQTWKGNHLNLKLMFKKSNSLTMCIHMFTVYLWCFFVFSTFFLLYVCIRVKANAWPFSQRINRSSVAAVTGEIRDWLCPRLSYRPSSSAMDVRVCVCVWEDTLCVCTWIRTCGGDRRKSDTKNVDEKPLKAPSVFEAWKFLWWFSIVGLPFSSITTSTHSR